MKRGSKRPSPEAIENHAIIGDMRTVALVDMNGTIDFMCWPRFDSPSVFASLLDGGRGGSFALQPQLQNVRRRQMYLPDTNVLLTRFLSPTGVAEISDFMVIHDSRQMLIRRVKAIRKPIRFHMRCAPAFDYARGRHAVRVQGKSAVFTPATGLAALRLRATVPLRASGRMAEARFTLQPNESAAFLLQDADSNVRAILSDKEVTRCFKATSDFWRQWVGRSHYQGRWRDSVNRSSLVLKLLSSRDFGSIVAAPTFGLPETVGGRRNWDYRYTWMRDAAFTVYAFLRLGYTNEATAFMRWLSARATACGANGSLRVLYNIDGGAHEEEKILGHLRGYMGSVPVCIGNAASVQLQLDIYGAVMDAVYLADKYAQPLSWQGWQGVSRSIEWVIANWQAADEGIWEIRSARKEFLHSRLMCWVALDRAIRLSRKRSLPAPLVKWSAARDEIYQNIHAHFWSDERKSFVQSKGSKEVDASCLLMPLVRFISPTDPRWLSTLEVVGAELMDDSLVYRYTDVDGFDGLDGKEGTFNMCSFWYVECLARAGDLPKARFYFEKMLGYANHVGLYAEETGPSGEALGNFPQAFTHLALISAAYYLDRALTGEVPAVNDSKLKSTREPDN